MLADWMGFSSADVKPEVFLRGRCGTDLKCTTAGSCIIGSLGSFRSSLRVNPVYPSSACIFILSLVRTDVSNLKLKQFLVRPAMVKKKTIKFKLYVPV